MIQEADRLSSVKEYYFSKKLQEVREVSASGTPVINLGIGNPDLQPSPDTIETLCESARTPGNHGYQSYRSLPELRTAIAAWMHRTYGVKIDGDNEVLPLIGSKEGITHISWAFVNPGDIVLVPNPGYPTYASVSRIAGAEVRTYDLHEENGWNPDLAQLRGMDLDRVRIIWINYPQMPTGAPFNDEVMRELIDLARKHHILICHDNPYSMILNEHPRSILDMEGAREVALELNSLSKSHNMAGWRMGWLSGNQKLIDIVLKVKSNVDSGMFLPIQHAAIRALQNPGEWHDENNAEYARRRKEAWSILDMLECTYSRTQSGMFIWARVPDTVADVEDFIDHLLYDARVFITPGKIFGSNGERYIRISLCTDIPTMKEAEKRIRVMLNKKTQIA